MDKEIGQDPAIEQFAQVEIFGHRVHWGRVTEVERFGTKMLRIDVPSLGVKPEPAAADQEVWETFFYGGASIFSMAPCTEEAARKWSERNRPRPYAPLSRLPAPAHDSGFDDAGDFGGPDGD